MFPSTRGILHMTASRGRDGKTHRCGQNAYNRKHPANSSTLEDPNSDALQVVQAASGRSPMMSEKRKWGKGSCGEQKNINSTSRLQDCWFGFVIIMGNHFEPLLLWVSLIIQLWLQLQAKINNSNNRPQSLLMKQKNFPVFGTWPYNPES